MKRTHRNHEVKLKLDKLEKDKLEKKANILGLKLTQYIRLVSINANVEVK